MLRRLFNRLSARKDEIPEQLVDAWLTRHPKTPDYHELEQHQTHLVFIYCDLRPGHRNASVLEHLHPIYEEVLTTNDYVLMRAQEGKRTFPIMLDPPETCHIGAIGRADRAPVRGSLYQLTTKEVEKLDIMKDNTVECERRRVNLDIPLIRQYQHERYEGVAHKRAYAYVGNFEFWSYRKFQTHPTLLKTRENNLKYPPRYHFTPYDDIE